MMTVVALGIALPINFDGSDISEFSHTTVENLNTESPLIWVHSLIVLTYLPIGAYVMRRFVKHVNKNYLK